MDFNELVRQVRPEESIDLVGLAIFYVDQIQGKRYAKTNELRELITKSRASNVSAQAFGAYIGHLKDRGLIEKHRIGYWLTHDGIEQYEDLTDEGTVQREEKFISIQPRDDFYESLVSDINSSYRYGIDDGALVLSRKLLENLVIDLLRTRYGFEDDNIDLFYDRDERQFKPFSALTSNLEENIEDFEYYSERLDGGLVTKLDSLRQQGNAGAHSVEVEPTDSEMENFQTKLNEVADVLFRVRTELRSSEQNHTDDE